MELAQNILLLVFVAAALIGYRIINKVPSLFHTPLMSGMNAFADQIGRASCRERV